MTAPLIAASATADCRAPARERGATLARKIGGDMRCITTAFVLLMLFVAASSAALGVFKEPEGAGVYIGFIAGVLGANPDRAEELIGKMLPMATADEWVIVRAIAYSGHHDWQRWLRKFGDRLPSRKVMIDKYLAGKLPTLDEIALEKRKPTLWDYARGYFVTDAKASVSRSTDPRQKRDHALDRPLAT
jgi:hypothetical protein